MRWQTGASCIAFALLWAVMTVARAEVREVDGAFVQQAIMAGYAAIASGEAALASKNPAIAAFGERMVREHAAMIDELASVAAAKGMELPTGASLPDQAEGLMLGILPGVIDIVFLHRHSNCSLEFLIFVHLTAFAEQVVIFALRINILFRLLRMLGNEE